MTRMKTRPYSLAWMLLSLSVISTGTAMAASSDEQTTQNTVSESSVEAEPDADGADDRELLKPKKSRLRFRGDRPTCMCADGLTEKDIRTKQRSKNSDTQSTDP